jgi:hypothetical protein
MRPIGFSTGAIAKGNFRRALQLLRDFNVDAVELSALRVNELQPLIAALPTLDLSSFNFVSIHAPSHFDLKSESSIVEALIELAPTPFPVVVHPDVFFTPQLWQQLGCRLLIENMDKRKPIGRTAVELERLFRELPKARLCFDIGHARQVDPSMTESVLILREFEHRLAEVHISEVNTSSRHDPISTSAARAFQSVSKYIPDNVPVIIESLIDEGQSDIPTERESAQEALGILPSSIGSRLRRYSSVRAASDRNCRS